MKQRDEPSQRLEQNLRLPYAVEVLGNEDGHFARVVEMPGCMTWTDRLEDLWPMLEDAMLAWIGVSLEEGDEVPLPDASTAQQAGLRLPEDIHRFEQWATPDGVPSVRFIIRRDGPEGAE